MNEIADFTALLTTLGILAFLVSVITQVTKELKFLRKIPTSLQVIRRLKKAVPDVLRLLLIAITNNCLFCKCFVQ